MLKNKTGLNDAENKIKLFNRSLKKLEDVQDSKETWRFLHMAELPKTGVLEHSLEPGTWSDQGWDLKNHATLPYWRPGGRNGTKCYTLAPNVSSLRFKVLSLGHQG